LRLAAPAMPANWRTRSSRNNAALPSSPKIGSSTPDYTGYRYAVKARRESEGKVRRQSENPPGGVTGRANSIGAGDRGAGAPI
jgi:hypothetical protein